MSIDSFSDVANFTIANCSKCYEILNSVEFTTLLVFFIGIILVLWNIVGNFTVILVIAKTKAFHTYCNFLLLNLSVSDLLVGLSSMSIVTVAIAQKDSENEELVEVLLSYVKVPLFAGFVVSSYTITLISFQRYKGITKPFKARTQEKGLKLMITILFMWTMAIFVQIKEIKSFFKDDNKGNVEIVRNVFIFTFCYIFPASILVYTYLRTVYLLWWKTMDHDTNQTLLKSRRRITKLLGMVLLVFNLTNIPLLGTHLACAVLHSKADEKSLLYRFLYLLYVSGSSINPVLYWFHSRQFRNAAKRIMQCKH